LIAATNHNIPKTMLHISSPLLKRGVVQQNCCVFIPVFLKALNYQCAVKSPYIRILNWSLHVRIFSWPRMIMGTVIALKVGSKLLTTQLCVSPHTSSAYQPVLDVPQRFGHRTKSIDRESEVRGNRIYQINAWCEDCVAVATLGRTSEPRPRLVTIWMAPFRPQRSALNLFSLWNALAQKPLRLYTILVFKSS